MNIGSVDSMVEVTLKQDEDFLKVKETLTRIGVASRKNRALYAHVRSSVAFKELELEVDEKRERDVEDLSAIVDSESGPSVE